MTEIAGFITLPPLEQVFHAFTQIQETERKRIKVFLHQEDGKSAAASVRIGFLANPIMLEEEMQALSFPYPETSMGDFSRIPVMGGYKFMWRNTPNQFQKFLYDIFKNGTRYTISEMILMLKTYKMLVNCLHGNVCFCTFVLNMGG